MTGIQNLFCRTSRFHESFIPYATTLWNNLSGEVRHSETLIIFKNTLKKNIVKLNQLYYIGPRKDAIQLARLRMNCSTLNKHMFKFGLTNSDRCSCNQGVEDTFHFFLFVQNILYLETYYKLRLYGMHLLLYRHYCQGALIVLRRKIVK